MEYFRENHVAIYGTPDNVANQLKALYKKVGGFGHLIAMLHAGDMEFDITAKSMSLFAEKVVPQIRDLGSVRKGFGPLPAKRKPRTA
jgi:alkanesulfonate monooxygenase SsuD/methylene tetrahydromethanopterin reductase-like flavin-dependent oxidoreductase (luciferase family)